MTDEAKDSDVKDSDVEDTDVKDGDVEDTHVRNSDVEDGVESAVEGDGVEDGVESAVEGDGVEDGGDDNGAAVDVDDIEVDIDPGLESEDPFAELDDDEDPFDELDADAPAVEDVDFEDLDATGEFADAAVEGDVDPFEEVEIEDIDEDVWEALAEGDVEIGGRAEPVEREHGEREDHIVDKRQYCQRCPHFTEPPEVACTHEGTDIVEVTDTDHFRVRGCPMIAEEGPTFDRT